MAKLAAAVALFLLVLSVAAFASPLDLGDGGGQDGSAEKTEDIVAEHEQEEDGFALFLGSEDEEEEEETVRADDRRVID